MVLISCDNSNGVSEFDPQDSFLIVGVDERHDSVAIIFEK
jgi:hypothetical protein